ncbi:restriction endonuclease subunit S [Clostridium perfringens]|uniref:restriction endonuclease subunit S n=1 Tax=Clostridium perfringens TaxID=1502 RepID=UPI001ABB77C9|nr:restriction endonuclease subunit S [Clostridium perfringens]MBO3368313.1 restriction endonuclease subunit S [Clostridium perfringens]UBK77952.1 restriction endonuclease subunit S [Clostridium perfringens]
MPNIKYKKYRLNEIFNFKKGTNEFNKAMINKNKGDNPVYSGQSQNNGIIGYTCLRQYHGQYIRIVTVGEAGKMSITDGDFCLAQNNGVLIPLDSFDMSKINLKFVMMQLEMILPQLAKGEGKQKSLLKCEIDKCILSFPLDKDGKIDLVAQENIANKYSELIEKKKMLLLKKEILEKSLIEVDFSNGYKHREYLINELFIPERGSGKYTKTYCNQHKGENPVYSSNTKETFFMIDSFDYDGKYITWSTDGLAGYIWVTNGKFSATDHRGILIPKKDINIENLDMNYLKYIIEPIFRKNIKGRMGHDGQNEYTSLKLNAVKKITQKIPIPIDDEGNFDLVAQQEIAKKYEKLYEVKQGVCEKIKRLASMQISLLEE